MPFLPSWAGGVAQAPIGSFVWGVHSTPSSLSPTSVQVTWFLGAPPPVVGNVTLAPPGAPCAGTCLGNLVATGSPAGAYFPLSTRRVVRA